MRLRKKVLSLFIAISMPLSTPAAIRNNIHATESAITQGKIYSGFKLLSEKRIKDIDSTALVFQHVKSGARLMYVKNSDVNKYFTVAFRTPVNDDTGVNHIIEHSVLCGSKNYPVKSALMQLQKKSMSTFLNALTGQDFTAYPVGSRNDKDFKNLMSVYLDAVFNPNMLYEPKIFRQEGWRYELENKNEELKQNGVVYNEMSGDATSAFTRLREDINKSLFPDTIYKYNSGGDPDKIPTLTRERLIETYKKYYRPSNSYFYLYGKIDLEGTLKYINYQYLSKFNSEKIDSKIKEQTPLKKPSVIVDKYSIGKDEDDRNKTYMSFNYSVPTVLDKESTLAFPMLCYLLTGSENSPLKKALKGIGVSDLSGASYSNSGIQSVLSITIANTEEKEKEKIQKVIVDNLTKVSKEGFDKNNIKGFLNNYELQNRFGKFSDPNAGLNYFFLVMQSWLYDGDPITNLETESTLKQIKDSVNKGYFQRMIKKYMLENKHSSVVIVKPEKGLSEKKNEELKNYLASLKKAFSGDKVDDIVRDTKELKVWQATPDSKEALSTIPSLKKEDLEIDIEDIPTEVKNEGGVKYLNHSLYMNKLSDINLYFDASKVPQDKLQYYSLYTNLLGLMGTKNYTYRELEDEKNMYTSSIMIMNSPVYDKKSDRPDIPKNYLYLTLTGLEENTDKLVDLCNEIINNSRFDDKERIKDKIKEIKEALDLIIGNSGGLVAAMKMNQYLNDFGSLSDSMGGIGFYKFISDLYKNFDTKWDEVRNNLEQMHKYVFNKDNLTACYTGEKTGYDVFVKSMGALVKNLSTEQLLPQNYSYKRPEIKNEGIKTQEKVLYVYEGGNLKDAGYNYEAGMQVLTNILNSGYLWDKVRVDGGAYGVGMSISSTGQVILQSAQDPNLKKTLKAFEEVADYLINFKATEEEMNDFIISTVKSATTKVLDPMMKGVLANEMYLSNRTMDDLRSEIKGILNTTAYDIARYGKMLKKVLEQGCFCVAGDAGMIEDEGDIFQRIETLSDIIK